MNKKLMLLILSLASSHVMLADEAPEGLEPAVLTESSELAEMAEGQEISDEQLQELLKFLETHPEVLAEAQESTTLEDEALVETAEAVDAVEKADKEVAEAEEAIEKVIESQEDEIAAELES
jgi:hypothetical protein